MMIKYIVSGAVLLLVIIAKTYFCGAMAAESQINRAEVFESNYVISLFTDSTIVIDGKNDKIWELAKPSPVRLAMGCDLLMPAPDCPVFGEVRSLWNGALVYLLIHVKENDISLTGEGAVKNGFLEIYFDLYNDKGAKYLEDDWMARISRKGDLSGKGSYREYIEKFAVAPLFDQEGREIGYSVEAAIHTGAVRPENGSSVGIDFCIHDINEETGKCRNRIFFSDTSNMGLDDNRRWGNLMLSGYDGFSPMAIDSFNLMKAVKSAEKIPGGIWISETEFDSALTHARDALSSKSQKHIDDCLTSLERAVRNLRRKGKYPDPMNLKKTTCLPDPFRFFKGEKVKSPDDWIQRSKEIKDLAQYYEYGYMPDSPEKVTASVSNGYMTISVTDKGKTVFLKGLLSLPDGRKIRKNAPYPVVISIDFQAMRPSQIFLNSGYAVLSIAYSTAASDDSSRKGAFYELYPYDVKTGNDAGTLLAWAWGAIRGVDALEYLAENNAEYMDALDLDRIVVTGFSRCGKAALLAGLLDERFGVVSPGASGCGGASVYRYDSTGNSYEWGTSPGCEVIGDKVRHQGHNSNEMFSRFLNYDRIYETDTHGYGERLPYDHHEIIAAIAPRAVLVTTAVDDYANNAEGDSIGVEGAKPVFRFLKCEHKLGLNIRMPGEINPWGFEGGHWQSDGQIKNLIMFSDMVFFGTPLSEDRIKLFYSNPYLLAYEKYYEGLSVMMPWLESSENE